MDEDTVVSLGVVVAILAVSAGLINNWVNRTEETSVLAFYVLNSKGNTDPRFYPKNVTAGEAFLLYLEIQNDGEETLHLRVEVKVGNITTPPPNKTTPSSLPSLKSLDLTASPKSLPNSSLQLALNQTGLDKRIIFELYAYDAVSGSLRYTGLWNQLWVNVTEPPS
jgi:uncharacterized membrane protein